SRNGVASIILCSTLVVVIHVELDTLFHGSFLISALEFFKVNILRGLGSFYGTHPWFWYFLVGLPTLLGPHLVPFLMSLGSIPRSIWPLLATILFSVVCLSVLPHKEFRFLAPLIPASNIISGQYLSRKWGPSWFPLLSVVLMLVNLPVVFYLGTIHQSGPLVVMSSLQQRIQDRSSVVFLMPCHSTPFYSHLHRSIPMAFLTCEPPPSMLANMSAYMDEADEFFEDPPAHIESWLSGSKTSQIPPTHVVMFDSLHDRLRSNLKDFEVVEEFMNNPFADPEDRKSRSVHTTSMADPPSCNSSSEASVLTADGKNCVTVKCKHCGSKILPPNFGTWVVLTERIPEPEQKTVTTEVGETESEEFGVWKVENIFHFDNMGFSNAVGNRKYLACADCEMGPVGFMDTGDQTCFVYHQRITYEGAEQQQGG
ncbi:unnamed protein product, partial [Cyprideis torosa]